MASDYAQFIIESGEEFPARTGWRMEDEIIKEKLREMTVASAERAHMKIPSTTW